MDPFVRRLVQRLHDPARPLSRNRHFHTFDTPEGRSALKLSRRLRSLQQDILASFAEGLRPRVSRVSTASGECRIELQMERIQGRRVSHLMDAEFELLQELPGVREALAGVQLLPSAETDAA
ncbi:hypothetical protein FGE12_09400 [Aggregicoccus sp. 17bor-14]|uniref:hypothetical protein n=1 Tax=Myxococcaceae TaxID=31 RepID=UPI00129C4497|nr:MULTISPECIES: hypothetical protein [Myxococcaceae]MBF5042615.1 hypothetical protein [Simulacricoccus sp. 17bor-14]MRI88383.1 hypothetical protein [Aggregicoccus sp. 17bor-14]